MIRKILIGLGVTLLAMLALGSFSLFLISTDKPEGILDVRSVLLAPSHKASADVASTLLKSVYDQSSLPSLSAAVGIGGELVWAGAIGYADLANAVPADAQTAYRIGSISKSMTATAFMRLQEQEKVELDTGFGEVVDDYRGVKAGFTMRHLLSHQAGIRHYTSVSETFSNVHYANTRDAAALVEQDDLVFEPGTGFHYSTYGYTLLSLAMEKVSARSLGEILAAEVFEPASMKTTSLQARENTNMSTPYLSIFGLAVEAPDIDLSYKYAGGGILSTPSDVVRFGNALVNETLLEPRSLALLFTPVVLANGETAPGGYALGFRNDEDRTGKFVHHGGVSVGGYSFLLIYPESQVVVAVVSNVMPLGGGFDRYAVAKKLADAFAPPTPS